MRADGGQVTRSSGPEKGGSTNEVARAPQATGPTNDVLALQGLIGNQAVVALLAAGQAKLEVGAANDPFEQEADATARLVVQALRSRNTAAAPGDVSDRPVDNPAPLRRKAVMGPEGGQLDAGTAGVIERARGGGRPLERGLRAKMQGAFGADFDSVRVHDGSQATALNRQLGAKAFTVGSDIFFRDGVPDTASAAGQELLAHELTHTIQQGVAPAASRSSIAGRATARRAVVQRDFADDFDWAGAGSIKRSGTGAEGVIFATSSAGEIVVKFLKAAAGASQADKTLAAAGIAVPASRVVKNSDTDPLGRQIRALVSGKLGTLDETKQVKVKNQLDTYTYIQLQEKAQATPLDQFDTKQITDFLADAALVQEVGKIAAVDSFMGNADRLSQKTVNTGNFMLAGGVGGPTLVAIDNEMKAGYASDKAGRESEVRFVMSQAGAEQMAIAFLSKLTGNFTKYQPTPKVIDDVKLNVKLGIKAGAEAIMALMKSQPNFIDQAKQTEKTQLPGAQGTHFKQRELVRKTMNARLDAMKAAYKSGGWAKLAPALDG